MPGSSAPSLTLAFDVPDYHALATAFADARLPQLTVAEARSLAAIHVIVPADASPVAIEVAVQFAASDTLRSRCFLAKLIAGGVGELYAMNYGTGVGVTVAEFAPVMDATAERAVA